MVMPFHEPAVSGALLLVKLMRLFGSSLTAEIAVDGEARAVGKSHGGAW